LKIDLIHSGRIGAILGGGPSLEADLKKVPKGAVLFAVNHHASQRNITADYTVFNDHHTKSWVVDIGNTKTVGRWNGYVDIYVPWEAGTLSAILAARLARRMGCAPILLCGMDCTGTHSANGKQKQVAIEWYTNKWANENPKDIQAVSGPLTKLFGKISSKVAAEPRTILVEIFEKKTVQLNERQTINFVKGEFDLPRHQAEAALAAGIAKRR